MFQTNIICSNEVNKKINNNFRFITNSTTFTLSYHIRDGKKGNYPYMGISFREGLALMFRQGTGSWLPLDLFSSSQTSVKVNMSHLIPAGEKYEVLIYGPAMAVLEDLQVEIAEDSFLEFPERWEKSILFLGGNKTFGAGVTSAAMKFSNAIGRYLNAEIVNAASLNRDFTVYMEDSLNYLQDISKYSAIVIEIDGRGNNAQLNPELLQKIMNTIGNSVSVVIWHALSPSQHLLSEQAMQTVEEIRKHNANLHYLNLDYILQKDYAELCTYSMNFINDAGNVEITNALRPILKECLDGISESHL